MPDLFSIRPSGEFVERYSFRTAITTADDGSEQRTRIRAHPTGSFDMGFVGRPGRDAQTVKRMLDTGQGNPWWVPWWPYASRLTAPASPGAGSVAADTADVPHQNRAGLYGPIALWSDPDTWEVHEITAASGGTITLADTVVGSWPAQTTLVVPVRRGWMRPEVSCEWPSWEVATGRVGFDLEVTGPASVEVSAEPTVSTLEVVPGRSTPIVDSVRRKVTTFAPGLGARTAVVHDSASRRSRTLRFVLDSRSAVRGMRDFLDLRFGRAVPFWAPSWQQDFVPVMYTTDELTFEAYGYTANLFPSPTYRRIYALSPDGTSSVQADIATAVDNLDGTETITFLGGAADITWRFMLLRYCRLDSDDVEIRWMGPSVATIDLPTIEVAA